MLQIAKDVGTFLWTCVVVVLIFVGLVIGIAFGFFVIGAQIGFELCEQHYDGLRGRITAIRKRMAAARREPSK